MTLFDIKPATEYSVADVADVLTRGFEGYFVPINIDYAALLTMIRRDGVDMGESRILLMDDLPIGVALIARRGWTSRLAAMGVVPDARNKGTGSWAMERLLDDARLRGDREMVLEVIEQNISAVHLYKKYGFEVVRRLVGYKLEKPKVTSSDSLDEVDIRELGRLVSLHGLPNLPWQLSGETIAHHTRPSRAFRLDGNLVLVSNPEAEHVAVWSVLVLPEKRRQSQGPRVMRALFSKFPNKTWHIPALCPEEVGIVFEEAGMKREELSQFQMTLKPGWGV
jgi:ribosomal protein S18 acetylase RimI-like enzyme